MPSDRHGDRRGDRDRDRRGGRSNSGRRERRDDRHEERRDRDRDRDRDRREREDRDRRDRGRRDRDDRSSRQKDEELEGRSEPEERPDAKALAVPEARMERHVIGVQGGVACHVLHRSKTSETGGARKNLDKFLEEIKNKHITSTELSTQQRQVHVKTPERLLRQVIDVLAKYVARYGEEFEEAVRADVGKHRHEIMENLGETRDIDFGFLGEKSDSQEAQYYRWKAFALAQGDGLRHWRCEPFQMCQDGTTWHPPVDVPSESSRSRSRSRSASGSRGRSRSKSRSRSRKRRRKHQERRSGLGQPAGSGRLGRRERKELARLLAALTPKVCTLLEAMCWCLDKAECAVQIAHELVEALQEADLTLAERVVRLYLISDVVHNSGSVIAMANAWCYRREFEAQLPEAFERLHAAYRGEDSRMVAERAGEQVSRILRSWQVRAVFSPQFIKGLEVSFFRDILSSDSIPRPGARTAGGVSSLPEAIFVKLAEWRSQHFSQLEKLAKARGLNWQTIHIQRPEDGRSLEQVRKTWLLDRMVTYELHAWETRSVRVDPPRPETPVKLPMGTASAIVLLSGGSGDQTSRTSVPDKGILDAAGADDPGVIDDSLVNEDIDGDPLSSGDEAWMASQAPGAQSEQDRQRRQAAAAAASRGQIASPASSPEGAEEDIDGTPVPARLSPPDGLAEDSSSSSSEEDEDEEEASDLDGAPLKDLRKFRSKSVKLSPLN
uniref:CID domain-containing protein n=1 Tax=Alexandrium monilatum TaxID=311494 RepID=A0A7S4RUJ3_9DINO